MQKQITLIKICLIIVTSCLISIHSQAQYQNSGISLTNTHSSAVNWVDIDGDGDLDLTISGDSKFLSAGQGFLYLNNTGTLSFNRNIRPIETGDMTWCDFNNDGYPDLLYAGEATGNTAGIDTFDIDNSLDYDNLYTVFTPVDLASVDWGDYDNDGDYDVLIAGQDNSGSVICKLYQNNDSAFVEVQIGLPGIINGKVAFIDYDLDMDLDIFICGKDANENKYSRLWINDNQSFSISSDIFLNMEESMFDWADYNNDTYPDLVIAGYDNTSPNAILYINNNGNSFTQQSTIFPGSQKGATGFGDIDNDGDLDVFMSGVKAYSALNEKLIFINDGSDSLKAGGSSITALENSFFQFGDFDKDDDLDFVVNGEQADANGLTLIMEDTCSTPNNVPTAPANTYNNVEGTSVILSWDRALDGNSDNKSLTYNIYLGTSSQGIDIVSPNASIPDGFRRIARQGYIQDTAWIIKNLSEGTYYWAVQAIDISLGASAFSSEGIFEIKDRFTETPFTETPSETSPAIFFDCDHDGDYDLFLNYSDEFRVAENVSGAFNQANYQTLLADGFNPINTITPNDFNNDNDIDFSISGDYTVDGLLDSTIALYTYNADFDYSILDSSLLKNVNFEYALWADLNNDGLQDVVTSGSTTNLGVSDKPVTYIYKNLGSGEFQEISHSIRGFEQCGATLADFDNDMDVDILIYGIDSTELPNTFLYKNEGDFTFSEHLISNNALYRYFKSFGISSGDFDLDGQMDIYMVGQNVQSDVYARVLLNQNLSFLDANLPIRSYSKMSNFWADYDYDGDLDIFSTSTYSSPDEMRIYLNNNGSLDEEIVIDLGDAHQLDLPFMAVNLDNQNGLDFIMKKNAGDYVQFYDNWGSNDRLTEAPTNLSYQRSDLDLILTWDKLPDCLGCTYNIRIGTHPDSVNIMSPMADLTTGFRYVIGPGNAYLNDQWKIKNLPAGKYYWSVQAIDLANTGGPWAELDTIVLKNINSEFSYDTVCFGDSTHFYDLSVATDSIVAWKWFFGDGTSETVQNPSHLYNTADTFNVVLWAYSESGDSVSENHDVIVMQIPEVDFSAAIVCQGNPTNFINNTNTNGLNITNWNWDFDDGTFSTDSLPSAHSFNAGEYNVELNALAANGCSDTISKQVQVAEYPSTIISVDGKLQFCTGDTVTLYVGDSNKANYTYEWLKDGNNFGAPDTFLIKATEQAEYSIRIENTIGSCVDTSDAKNVIVYEKPLAQAIQMDGETTLCEDESLSLYVEYFSDYTYQWYSATGAVGIDSSKYAVENSGSYHVKITNEHGCENYSADTIDAIINPLPVIPNISQSGNACDSIRLSVLENADLNYQWIKDGLDIENANDTSYYVIESGNYTLRITNTNGCSEESENIAVTIKPKTPQLTITAASNTTFCTGNNVELSVPYNVDYTYNWYRNGSSIEQHENTYVATADGTYTVEVNNTYNCPQFASNSVEVVTNDLPVIPDISQSGNACDSIKLSVPDNTDYTYQWKKEGTVIENATNSSHYVTDIGSANYTLRITDTNGCSEESENIAVTIKQKAPQLTIVAASETEFCDGGEVELSVPYNSEYTYNWLRNGGSIERHESAYLATDDGDYTVEVNNVNNCPSISLNTVSVNVKERPLKPAISLSRTPSFCQGDSIVITIDEQSGVSYQWMNANTEIPNENSKEYVAYESGNYYVDVINTTTACSNRSDTTTVIVSEMPGKPIITTSNYDIDDCPQEKIITLSINETSNDYTYQWMKNGLLMEGATESELSDYLEEGNYSLIVRNQGCENESDNIAIVYNPELPDKPSIEVKGPAVWYLVCTNDQANEYEWYYENEKVQGADEYIYVPGENMGTYFVRIAEENGCFVSSDEVTIPITGVEDLNPFANLKIYPNPTPGVFNIEMDNEIYGELFTRIFRQNAVEIFNIKYDKTTRHFKAQINLSGQGCGIYIISLSLDNYQIERKIIIE